MLLECAIMHERWIGDNDRDSLSFSVGNLLYYNLTGLQCPRWGMFKKVFLWWNQPLTIVTVERECLTNNAVTVIGGNNCHLTAPPVLTERGSHYLMHENTHYLHPTGFLYSVPLLLRVLFSALFLRITKCPSVCFSHIFFKWLYWHDRSCKSTDTFTDKNRLSLILSLSPL